MSNKDFALVSARLNKLMCKNKIKRTFWTTRDVIF